MAVQFSVEQVLEATGGRLLRPCARMSFDSVSTDTRKLGAGCLFVALQGERFDAHDFLSQAAEGGAAAAVVDEGRVPPGGLPEGFGLIAVPHTLQALGALGRYHRLRFRIPVGAVGGSNGKTTTKEMVGSILATRGPALKTEGNLNNEVGAPLTLLRLEKEHVAAVVELGMNQPGEMARLCALTVPDAAVLTVVQPEHLEGLGSLEGVAAAEGELFAGLGPEATAVVNLDDPWVTRQAEKGRARKLGFGRAAAADVRLLGTTPLGLRGQEVLIGWAGTEHRVGLSFVGEHNAHNATAAFALALALGFSPEACVQGLEAARPYARRLNVLEAPGGVIVLDDCYNANPASMAAALETVQSLARGGRAVAVLGDMLELGGGEEEEHRALGARVPRHVALAAFFGPRSQAGFEAAGALGEARQHFTEVESLVAWLRPELRPKDVVLVKGSRGMKLERVVQALGGQALGGVGAGSQGGGH